MTADKKVCMDRSPGDDSLDRTHPGYRSVWRCYRRSLPWYLGRSLNQRSRHRLTLQSYLVDTYILYSASALAGNTVIRSIFGVVLPLFTVRMYDELGVHWAGSLIGFIALAFLPAPM